MDVKCLYLQIYLFILVLQSPTISIVTINFNDLTGLKKTLKSVAALNFKDYEHIVVDGASTDGSVEFLSSYKDHPISLISEKDSGIYDAMNKGISLAKGKWTIFMNGGDRFLYSSLQDHLLRSEADILYGSSQILYPDGFIREMHPTDLNRNLWKGMSFTHQAVFCKTSLLKAQPFDTIWKHCADFDQLFQFFIKGLKFEYLPILVCEIEAGGISDKKRYRATYEVYRINKKLAPAFHKHFYFMRKIVGGFIVAKLKGILPRKFSSKLVKAKHT